MLVTDRGRVVAELVLPRPSAKPTTAEEILAQLKREGILISAKRRAVAPPECLPLASFEDLMRGLAADRADR